MGRDGKVSRKVVRDFGRHTVWTHVDTPPSGRHLVWTRDGVSPRRFISPFPVPVFWSSIVLVPILSAYVYLTYHLTWTRVFLFRDSVTPRPFP